MISFYVLRLNYSGQVIGKAMLILGEPIFKLCLQPCESILIKCYHLATRFFLLDSIRPLCEAFSITSLLGYNLLLLPQRPLNIRLRDGLLVCLFSLDSTVPDTYEVSQ